MSYSASYDHDHLFDDTVTDEEIQVALAFWCGPGGTLPAKNPARDRFSRRVRDAVAESGYHGQERIPSGYAAAVIFGYRSARVHEREPAKIAAHPLEAFA